MLKSQLNVHLTELIALAELLNPPLFTAPLEPLSGSTIGQHFRHCIEFIQCLQLGHLTGTICYDNRKRDQRIENSPAFAIECMKSIIENLPSDSNHALQIQQSYQGQMVISDTSYARELLFNIEHIVHHQALIKTALNQLNIAPSNDTFGIASSTIEYRKNVHLKSSSLE